MPSKRSSPIHCPTKAMYPKASTNRLRTRQRPPLDHVDEGEWLWRTQSPIYRRRVKRAVQMVASYRLLITGDDYLDRADRDAIHRLLDTLTFDPTRRLRGGGERVEPPQVSQPE